MGPDPTALKDLGPYHLQCVLTTFGGDRLCMCMVELDPEVSHRYALTSLLCKNGINKHSLGVEYSGSN